MKEVKYYDSKNNRLVFIGSKASDEYWDSHWQADDFKKMVQITRNPLITSNTQKYLPVGSSILEGGCGRGQNVYLLNKKGYNTTGIDYAEKTVEKIKEYMPELKVKYGDIRDLPFNDNEFDGYWSLGVIEHFYNGYDDIRSEMHRVLKKGGILFMTVPSMSVLRRFKAKRNKYPLWVEDKDKIEHFYQFALDQDSIINNFESNGFKLIESKPIGGFKGLKDEVAWLKKPMQKIYDSQFILSKIINKVMGIVFERFSSHVTFFVFQKI